MRVICLQEYLQDQILSIFIRFYKKHKDNGSHKRRYENRKKVVIIDLSIIHFNCVLDKYAFEHEHIYDKSIGLGIDLNT